jgi:hypothetical protein
MGKRVQFDLGQNETFVTHTRSEYDRSQIDHVLYRKSYNRVSEHEMKMILISLDLYKLYEMPVSKESLHNNSYQAKQFIFNSRQG